MMKIFNAAGLKQPVQGLKGKIKNRKENFNTNLSGPNKDTFELKSNYSTAKNVAFTGKKSTTIDDINAKLNRSLDPSNDYRFKLSDNQIDIINKELVHYNSENRDKAKVLVTRIGISCNDDIQKKLTEKIINPLLKSDKLKVAAIGIEIVGGISSTNSDFVNKNFNILDPFIKEEQLNEIIKKRNIEYIKQPTIYAISAIGDIGAGQPVFAKRCYEKIEAMPDIVGLPTDINAQKLNSLAKIAKEQSRMLSPTIVNRLMETLNKDKDNSDNNVAGAAINGLGSIGTIGTIKDKRVSVDCADFCVNNLTSFINNPENQEAKPEPFLLAIRSLDKIMDATKNKDYSRTKSEISTALCDFSKYQVGNDPEQVIEAFYLANELWKKEPDSYNLAYNYTKFIRNQVQSKQQVRQQLRGQEVPLARRTSAPGPERPKPEEDPSIPYAAGDLARRTSAPGPERPEPEEGPSISYAAGDLARRTLASDLERRGKALEKGKYPSLPGYQDESLVSRRPAQGLQPGEGPSMPKAAEDLPSILALEYEEKMFEDKSSSSS